MSPDFWHDHAHHVPIWYSDTGLWMCSSEDCQYQTKSDLNASSHYSEQIDRRSRRLYQRAPRETE